MTARWMIIALGLLVAGGCRQLLGFEEPVVGEPPATTGWTAITAGFKHTCALQADRSLWCWGENQHGQVSALADVEVLEPLRIGTASWLAVEAGARHTCAIDERNAVWCWGQNTYGQVGNGTISTTAPPTLVLGDAIAVTTGFGTTCGLKSDGSLWCWGTNLYGQLGTWTDQQPLLVPTQIGERKWSAVATGDSHACGLDLAGAMWCWGAGFFGAVVPGVMRPTSAADAEPTQVEPGRTWTSLALGRSHTCGIRDDERLRCWGYNAESQIGAPAAYSAGPVDIGATEPGRAWTRVQASAHNTCALRDDDTLWCWGAGTSGQLARPDLPIQVTPIQITDRDASWSRIALGDDHLCAITTDNELACVGNNTRGQLGAGTGGSRLSPVVIPGQWYDIDAGDRSVCARDLAGAVHCWGEGLLGQLGQGTELSKQVPTFTLAGTTGDPLEVGFDHACAGVGSMLVCWGSNLFGESGQSSPSYLVTPTALLATAAAIDMMALGLHTCWLDDSSQLRCFGSNSHGQLGIPPDSAAHPTPMLVLGGPFTRVTTGRLHTCAIRATELSCWGDNANGQLGRPGGSGPLAVSTGWKIVTAGTSTTCAVDTADHLSCWGRNAEGQVGDGTKTERTAPARIGNATWRYHTLGLDHGCGILLDGSLYCWGNNERGQLGTGSRAEALTPTLIGTDKWGSVDAGTTFTCGIKSMDKSLWCWGSNAFGQIGDGSAWIPTFVRVAP